MRQTVYIASPEGQQVHVWDLDHEDVLTLTQVIDMPGQMRPMAVSPDRRYLYADARPGSRVLTCCIALDDGALAFAAESALPENPTHTSTDHLGQFVFVGSYNTGNVSVTRLGDGLPVGVVDVVEGLDGCHSASISPDNHTLWVPVLKQDHIYLFTVSDDGHLVAQDPTEVTIVEGAGLRYMVFHPDEQYACCISELNSSVDVWELKDLHSNIGCVQALDMMPESFSDTRWAANIHITPDGRHLCTCDRTASLIIVFSVSEDGSMLSKEGFQPTEAQPCGSNVDHSGKHLIAARQKSHHISVYEIVDERGLLHKKGRYAVG